MSLKTLDQALEVFKYFTKEHPAWGVRELAKELDKSHSIIHRILSTYEQHGFLKKNEDTKKYELGLKFFEYSVLVQDQLKITDIVDPYMNELAEKSKETVFLTWHDRGEGVCLSIAKSSHSILFSVSVGSRTPLYAGASGKAVMAFLSEKEQAAIIEKGVDRLTSNTITNPEQLINDLEAIRKRGWCYTLGEYSDEVVGLGIPLFNHKNQVIASLTIAAPSYRLSEERAKELLDDITYARDQIQGKIRTYQLNP
ncbi:IclR family transcriptional regulator [Scopulibacillus darangshiensis]|uniref:IclR family transcriptional regulator n=1 Tax=Scopulibacillus darangshiensis TaxID=442528 RepID=A0A4R2P704_9BACL|nr:IclR family transcriptional regulator [Scopulibacillus darangshiensis]TCP29585.1 IclR family transcriptional regulator [Scopulibacillus darangshiensis]